MRIAVIDIAARVGGAKSILMDFYKYVTARTDDKNEWFFFVGKAFFEETSNIHVIVKPDVPKSWIKRLKYDQFDGKKDMRKVNPDIILNFQNTCINYSGAQQYLYIHQPIPFQQIKKYSFLKKEEFVYAVYQYVIGGMIKHSAKRANGIIVQTEWMKKEVGKYTDLEKIKVIPPTIEVDEQLVHQETRISGKEFFFPAAYIIYKNHRAIAEAVRILNNEGYTDFEVLFTVEDTMHLDWSPCIKCVGSQSRDIIMDWYKSKIMIFPSYIETFGMPLAECRRLNGVVLAASTAFAHEILKDYENAFYFPPFEPTELASMMKKAIEGKMVIKQTEPMCACSENTWGQVVNILEID